MRNPEKRNLIEALSLNHRVVFDPTYADKTWIILENAIHQIFNHNSISLSYEELYRNVYNMVVHESGEKLYSGLVKTMTTHLKETSRSIESSHGASFFQELNQEWIHHNKSLQLISDILRYMDRNFIPIAHKTPVYQLGLNLWRENVIQSDNINTRLLNTLFDLILEERTAGFIDRGTIRIIIKMLIDLGSSAYQDVFEKPFLEVSADFYRAESRKLIECCDCGEYMKKAEIRLSEEIDRVSHYLDASSVTKITGVVEKEMIFNHMERLIHMEGSDLVSLIVNNEFEDLRRMYNLFNRVPNGLSMIRDVMSSHVRELGKMECVQSMLDAKDKYSEIIELSFNNDTDFESALNSSFEYLTNLNRRSPELISLFLDHMLRKGLEDAIVVDKVMVFVHFLHEKDVFEKYYKQHLCKRLLSGKVVDDDDDDDERLVIVKLRTECGSQFASKLQTMFRDTKTSEETMRGFCNSLGVETWEERKLDVRVIAAGCWPIQPSPACNLPAELSAYCDKFKSYYLEIRTGRKLSWQTNMGTADLIARFGKSEKHELYVTTHQMCVLMLFNSAERLSYKEIERATKIPTPEMKRCLQTLACVKGKNVIRKEPMRKDVGEDDVFLFNDKFTSKYYKVKIGMVVAKEESEIEMLETRKRVEEDRRPQIDAAIVRIMKSRRVVDHNDMIVEVTKMLQCRFLANAEQIKKRIESLMEREFLERDTTDRKLYRYLA